MMHNYRMHGYVVASDLDLHLPEITTDESPTMVLRRSPNPLKEPEEPDPAQVIARIWQEPPGLRYYVSRTFEGYRFYFDGLGEFEMSHDLVDVSWKAADESDPGIVPVLAAGTLMAFRLSLAGHLVLHASVVRAQGRGLAFVGGSGMGKSTMATLLCAGGAELLTDDVARVDLDADRPLVWPGCVESRLRTGSLSLLSAIGGTEQPGRSTEDGRTAVCLPFWAGAPLPLDAVVIPIPSTEVDRVNVEKVTVANGLVLLSKFPRIAGWTDDTIRTRQFNLVGQLAKRVPVHLATVPWGPPFAPETGPEVLGQLGWL